MREKNPGCACRYELFIIQTLSHHPISKFSVIDLCSQIFTFFNQFFFGIMNIFVFVQRWEGNNGKYRPLFLKWETFLKFGLLDFENLIII